MTDMRLSVSLAGNGMRLVGALGCAGLVLAALCAPRAGAQGRRLTYVRDTSLDLVRQGQGGRTVTALVRRDGYMIVAPEYFYGDAIAFDSTGKRQAWHVRFGGGGDAEVGFVTAWGWAGDSLWVADNGYRQLALIGGDGKIARSIGFPTWVLPTWHDRRQYPLFARMNWYAMYGDGTLLVEPYQVRRLFDTPGYDPDQKLLVRIDRDGRILRTVARAPAMEGQLLLRSGTERKTWNVPNYPRSYWKTSTDGERVVLVAPIPSDSGAFRVTMVSSLGDTLFSRRYAIDAARVSRAAIDSFLTTVKAFGRYNAQQVRDTITKLIPPFRSPVAAVLVGVDHSVWVSIRRPKSEPQEAEWMVMDERGDVVGTTMLRRMFKMTAVSVDHLWSVETDRVRQNSAIVRYRRTDARVVRPTRSASSSGSSSPARPRE
jgi:hypothetical protein